MDGKKLTAMLLLLTAMALAFVSAPVLSGEHPWDSDRSGGGGTNPGGGTTIPNDTTIVPDTAIEYETVAGGSSGSDPWISVLTAAWTATWTM